MKRKTAVLLTVLLIGLAGLVVGCSSTNKPAASTEKPSDGSAAKPEEVKPTEIRVGFASGFLSGVTNYAQEKGWWADEFAKDGIEVKFVTLAQAGPAVNEGLASKSLDIAVFGDTPAIFARANGLKTRLISANRLYSNLQVIVPPDSSLKTVRDLKGKKVAFIKGTILHYFFGKLLAANGLTFNDIEQVNLATGAEITAAIVAKQVDAAVSLEFLYGQALKEGKVKVLYDTADHPEAADWRGQLVIIGREEWLDQYPATVKRWLKVYDKAAQWALDNKAQAFALDAKTTKLPLEVFKKNEFTEATLIPALSAKAVSVEQDQLNFWLKEGIVKPENKFDIVEWADAAYVKSLSKSTE